MFHDLDTALGRLLSDPQAPPPLLSAEVTFVTPERGFQPAQDTAVNLFLFEVSENRELRDPLPLRESTNGIVTTRRPPVRVDCSYLVTAWSRSTGAVKVQQEHQLLSEAFLWLTRFPVIPDEYFDFEGSRLIDPVVPPPAIIAHMSGERSPGEFWQALGIPPRPAFYLIVTIALDPAVVLHTGTEVVTRELVLHAAGQTETLFEIGGTVRNRTTSAPIASATVTLVESGRQATTDAAGRFRLAGLGSGQYTLHAASEGYGVATRIVQVPGTSPTAFDLGLVPSP